MADVGSVVESGTESNKRKFSFLLAPEDAIGGDDPVVLKYTMKGFEQIWQTEINREHYYEGITIRPVVEHIHQGAKTYSIEFSTDKKRFILVPCGKFYEGMIAGYKKTPDIMVFNTTFLRSNNNFFHLSAEDVEKIIREVNPKKAVITHYSLLMLRENPTKVAKALSDRTGVEVIAAEDGLKVEF